jgi:hypothetical protein
LRRPAPTVALFAVATILLVCSLLAAVLDPLPEGLSADYFNTPDWSGAPARSTIDSTPSTYCLFVAWRGRPPQSFSATWTGWMIVLRQGTYSFAATTDSRASLRVGEQLIFDNGQAGLPQPAVGRVQLRRGVHRLLVTYYQTGGSPGLELNWARDAAALQPLPAWALSPRRVAFTRFAVSVVIRRFAALTVWPWLAATALALGAAIVHPFRRARANGDAAAAVEWSLIFAGGALLLFVLPHWIASDGYVRYFSLAQLIEWRELPTTSFSLVGPLASAPLYFLGRFVASPRWWCERFNTLVLLAGISVMWQLLRKEVAPDLFRKFALLLLAASMFPNHILDYFGEVFTAVTVATGLLAVQLRHRLSGWAAVIAGVVNTPATLVGLAATAVVLSWRTRRLRYFLPVAIAATLILLEAWIRRGALIDRPYLESAGNPTVLTYSGKPGFSYPLFFGLLSVLFSFGKGLFFYAPGLLLPVRRQLREISARVLGAYDLWIAFLVGIVLVYARWWAWFGGWTWGPRFFLIAAIPASYALAVALHRVMAFAVPVRAAILAVLTLSAWVAIDGAVFGQAALDLCFNDTFASLCWYVPEFSPLWRPFVQFTAPSPAVAMVGVYFTVVYVWMAAPLVRDLSPRTVAMVSAGWRALSEGERWRI